MNSFDFTQVSIRRLITHHIGNKLRNESVKLSSDETNINSETIEYLLKYFLLPFKSEEIYSFTHSVSLEMNEVYHVTKKLFASNKNFVKASQSLATLLHEYSMHPRIKSGELHVAYLSNVSLDSDTVDAIGIFKSENDTPYLKMKDDKSKYSISHDRGYDLKSMDKGCLIFNIESDNGYKILTVDVNNKFDDAQYWKDSFLKIRPLSDNYHFTKNFLTATKDFITNRLPSDFEMEKTDQIEYLNKSVNYFRENQTFNIGDFEKNVFEDDNIIKSFRKFGSSYLDQNSIDIADTFEISSQALKKQERIFKSVLKLDKNFHVYIHGRSDLLEKGYDSKKGKHYYKIYFDEEQ
jgi:hypothetical protein